MRLADAGVGYSRTLSTDGLDLRAVGDLLEGATQIYVGVLSRGKPHVTPELLATSGGRLWCLTAAVTQKAKILAVDERVAFMASVRGVDVVGVGRASIVDPGRPSSLTDVGAVARSAAGTASFVLRNAAELSGAAVDALTGKLGGPLPPRRVALSVEPFALAVLSADGVRAVGEWETGAGSTSDGVAASVDDLEDTLAPEAVRDLIDDGPAALGWLSASGHPLVLPAQWRRATSSARVNEALFERCGAADASPAAVTRDKWTGYGPTGKQGLMLRGDGNASSDGEAVAAAVAVDRVTYWDGVETGSNSPSS